MWLVVGLGNPGKKYERTRHNVGFMAVDAIAAKHAFPPAREKFSAQFTRAFAMTNDVAILKPQTFMNDSGDSVQPAAAFLKVQVSDVIVIHDELDLPFGTVRLKKGGGHGGHNGLRSLLERLGAPDFVRVRMGVGRPPADFKGDVADYVLGGFASDEAEALQAMIAAAEKAVATILKLGVQDAMNRINVAPKPLRPHKPKPNPEPEPEGLQTDVPPPQEGLAELGSTSLKPNS
jgi:peptidyl-tRNA hydrolase, PTH1 family